jgi:hypothetical protein
MTVALATMTAVTKPLVMTVALATMTVVTKPLVMTAAIKGFSNPN